MRKITNKKALSEIVAYVILITIALSMSTIVYIWLKGYLPTNQEECPDGVSIIIKDYNCTKVLSGELFLNLTIQNKGLFTTDGFVIKVNDRDGASIGLFTLKNTSEGKFGAKLQPGEMYNYKYSLKNNIIGVSSTGLTKLSFIEIQPFIYKGEQIYCNKVSSQIVKC